MSETTKTGPSSSRQAYCVCGGCLSASTTSPNRRWRCVLHGARRSAGGCGVAYAYRAGRDFTSSSRASRLTKAEKVAWPTRRETVQMTLIVFRICSDHGIFLFAVDYLDWLHHPVADQARLKRPVRRNDNQRNHHGKRNDCRRRAAKPKRWYVVRVLSGSRRTCRRRWSCRADVRWTSSARCSVPVEETGPNWHKAEVNLEAQVLPGLCAGRNGNDRRDWHLVKARPGDWVHRAASPATSTDFARVDNILNQVQTGGRKAANTGVVPRLGEAVRVKAWSRSPTC